MRLEAIDLFVTDPERSVEFYVEQVGATHGHVWQHGYTLRLDDHVVLRLHEASGEVAEDYFGGEALAYGLSTHPRGQGVVLTLMVDDIEEHFARAQTSGTPLFPEGIGAPVRLPNGSLSFTLIDPDGYLIRLVEAPSAAVWAEPEEEARE